MTTRSNHLWWTLRLGAAMCFIGHGAFGIIGKKAWLPYFAAVGIPPEAATYLMPLIGIVDIAAGISMLFRPTLAVLAYMTVWATWTAMLRPLSGEPFAEALERAGNYGVPLAMLLMCEIPHTVRGWFAHANPRELTDDRSTKIVAALLGTTATLLLGHGLLGVGQKQLLVQHVGLLANNTAAHSTTIVGWFELTLAAVIGLFPVPLVAGFVAGWKMATESLFIAAGAPIWEFIERGGSYAAPLALLLLGRRQPLPRIQFGRVVPHRGIAAILIAAALSVLAKPVFAQQPAVASTPSLSDEELLARLRKGGLALACRHAITDHSNEDRSPVDYNDRSSQRNLSPAGERQARALGEAIRAAKIPVGQVFANRLFRTRESATLAFERAEVVDSLDGNVLRRMLQQTVPAGENRVFMTRAGMLSTALRSDGSNVPEGSCLAVEPRSDAPTVVSRLSPDDFARLGRLSSSAPEAQRPLPR